jgi:hypothetical protein
VNDPIDCWFGATWYPFVSARQPTFVQISQLDEVIGLEIHPTLELDAAAMDAWRAQLRATTASVPWFFSGTETYHVLTVSDGGWATGPAGSTLQQMVSRFFDDGPPERVTFSVPGPCVPSATTLCLSGGRFRVEVDWETGQGAQGAGQALELTADSGLFWFFNPNNIELVVKVLNACTLNQRYWGVRRRADQRAHRDHGHRHRDRRSRDLHQPPGHRVPSDPGHRRLRQLPVAGNERFASRLGKVEVALPQLLRPPLATSVTLLARRASG